VAKLSYVDCSWNTRMVDIGDKSPLRRPARASGRIEMAHTTAQLAGAQSAMHSSELIPLCHQLQLSHVPQKAEVLEDAMAVACSLVCMERNRVDMEALTGASAALLTSYDRYNAVGKDIRIGAIAPEENTKHVIE